MKPLSERIAQKILDHDSIILLRPDISHEIQELIQLEDINAALLEALQKIYLGTSEDHTLAIATEAIRKAKEE